LTWLNLEENDDFSPDLQSQIGSMMASRWVLKSICKCLSKPMDKKLMPWVIHGVQMTICHRMVDYQEATAGPIFLLVRTTALDSSKVVKVGYVPPSRRGLTAGDA
jgi:hypothetical protein